MEKLSRHKAVFGVRLTLLAEVIENGSDSRGRPLLEVDLSNPKLVLRSVIEIVSLSLIEVQVLL